MSLALAINFNENSTTAVYDYSGNGNNASTVTSLTIQTVIPELGNAGVFDGSATKLDFGDIASVEGTDNLTIFCKFYKLDTQKQYIAYKQGQYALYLDASNNVVFEVEISGTQTLTSSATISATTWTTIAAVYDGANMYIYIDGSQDNSTAQTGNIDTSDKVLLIGTDNTDFLEGYIEALEIRTDAVNADGNSALDSYPTGIKYETATAHNFDLGDLIVGDKGGTPQKMVVTHDTSSTVFYAKPAPGKIDFGHTPIRVGNNGATSANQWTANILVSSGLPYIHFNDNVTSFTNNPDTSSVIDLGGITDRGFLPPVLTTSQRDNITTPATGLMVYDSSLGKPMYYTGSSWRDATGTKDSIYSMTLDGADEFFKCDDVSFGVAGTTTGTWSFWIKIEDATPATIARLMSFGDTNANTYIFLGIQTDGTLQFSSALTGANQFVSFTDAAPLTSNTWHHIVVGQDGSDVFYYVDGSAEAWSYTVSTNSDFWFADASGLDNFRIGELNFNSAGEEGFNPDCSIWGVSIWDTNLSAAEISELYGGGEGTNPRTHTKAANLVAYYDMGKEGEYSTNWHLPNAQYGLYNKKSLLLDGSAEYVDIDLCLNTVSSDASGTISIWVKPVDATPASGERLVSFGDTNADEYLEISITTGGLLQASCNDAGTLQWHVDTDSAVFSDDTWTHVCIVQDRTEPTLYINGVAQADTFNTAVDKARWFTNLTGLDNGRIGTLNKNSGGETGHFNGNVDHFSMWNTNFTAAEVLELWNKHNVMDLNDHSKIANLVCWYRFDDGVWDGSEYGFSDWSGYSNQAYTSGAEEADLELDVVGLLLSQNMEEIDREQETP